MNLYEIGPDLNLIQYQKLMTNYMQCFAIGTK